MGTNISGVFLPANAAPDQILGALSERLFGTHPDVILHMFTGALGAHSFVWLEASGKTNRVLEDIELSLARLMSSCYGRAVHVGYSDSTGRDECRTFSSGTLTADASLASGISSLLPGADIRDADDLFDLVYGESVAATSYILVKNGERLLPPQPWQPTPVAPRSPSLLHKEFTSLQGVRRVFTWGVYAFGAVMGLLILYVLLAFLVEAVR